MDSVGVHNTQTIITQHPANSLDSSNPPYPTDQRYPLNYFDELDLLNQLKLARPAMQTQSTTFKPPAPNTVNRGVGLAAHWTELQV